MSTVVEKKSFGIKADTVKEGVVHAVVSCFGNKDSDDDIVVKGFFDRSIKEAKSVNKFPPGIFSHDWKMPVARTDDAWEGDDGLHVIGDFNMKTQRGRETFFDIDHKILTEYSFGYMNVKGEHKDGVRYMKTGDWLEWSPVLIGANRLTNTVEAKSANMPGVESDMVYGAMNALLDEVWYKVYRCCFDSKTSYDEHVALLDAVMSEAHQLAVSTYSAMMKNASTEQSPDTYDLYKSRWAQNELPLGAKALPWSEADAVANISEWAAGDNVKYRSCFLSMHKDAKECKLPIADVVGHRALVVPAALKAASEQVDSLPEEARDSVKAALGRWSLRLKTATGEGLSLKWEGVSFEKQVSTVLGAVEKLAARAEEVKSLRGEKGQDLSQERKSAMVEMSDRLRKIATTNIIPETDELRKELARFELLNARLNGAI